MLPKTHEPLKGYHPAIGGFADPDTGASRPSGMPRKEECDYVVSDKNQLVEHVTEDGAKIYIDETVGVLSLEPMEGEGVTDVKLGSGVQLVGQFCDPGHPGRGTVIHQPYYNRHTFKVGYGKKPPTLWGISLQGPMFASDFTDHPRYPSEEDLYFDPRSDSRTHNGELDPSDWYASGVFCHTSKSAGEFRAIGCEFFGWSHSGLEIGSKERETQAEIRRCSFHNNLMETLGYGIEQYNGHMWVDRSFFDRNRHGISGFGYPTQSWEATNCLVGDGLGASHAFDEHDLGSNITTDTPNMGGHHIAVRNCTFLLTHDVNGDKQEPVVQRGQSLAGRAHYDGIGDKSQFEENGDEISYCHFAQPEKPKARGKQGDAYREDDDGAEWKSLNPHDNIFGLDHPEEQLAQHGAPRARTDGGTESPDEQPADGHTLTIEGVDEPARYLITIKGEVTGSTATESPDKSRSSNNGKTVITGEVVGGADQYHLSPDSTVTSARLMGPMKVRKDGNPLETLASITSAEAHQEMWGIEDDLQKQIEGLRTNLNAIETGLDPDTKTKIDNAISQVTSIQEQLDRAHISFSTGNNK